MLVLVEGLLLPKTAKGGGNGKQAELNDEQGGKSAGRREGEGLGRGGEQDGIGVWETYGPDYS